MPRSGPCAGVQVPSASPLQVLGQPPHPPAQPSHLASLRQQLRLHRIAQAGRQRQLGDVPGGPLGLVGQLVQLAGFAVLARPIGASSCATPWKRLPNIPDEQPTAEVAIGGGTAGTSGFSRRPLPSLVEQLVASGRGELTRPRNRLGALHVEVRGCDDVHHVELGMAARDPRR